MLPEVLAAGTCFAILVHNHRRRPTEELEACQVEAEYRKMAADVRGRRHADEWKAVDTGPLAREVRRTLLCLDRLVAGPGHFCPGDRQINL